MNAAKKDNNEKIESTVRYEKMQEIMREQVKQINIRRKHYATVSLTRYRISHFLERQIKNKITYMQLIQDF